MGFRRDRCTTDQMVLFENAVQNAFAQRQHLLAIFLDIEKAYDTTWRYGILKKIYNWGLKGRLPKFITSFLRNRQFRVRIGNTLSDTYELENGVPQGSTLSVTLFLIAVDELISSISHPVKGGLFVDDLVIYLSGKRTDNLEEMLQANINIIEDKAVNLGFKLSSSKTFCVHFCRLRSQHTDPQLTVNNTIIEVRPTARVLGLIFDSKLTWVSHIRDLAVRAKKSLNILRCMANIVWGSDREILLRLYMALILPKIDYGCFVYGSARQSRLRALDSIHCMALRIATGAFRTSPLTSICCEAGIPPLKFRRQRLLLNYIVKIWALPDHPVHSTLFRNEIKEVYESRTSITRPVGIRASELMMQVGLHLPEVFSLGFCEIPPWTITPPKVNLDLTYYSKSDTNPGVIRKRFKEILNGYQPAVEIYTDGSKTTQGVGCAFSTKDESHMWSLPSMASIYTAELYSIWQALRFSEILNATKILIISDSLSSLQALNNIFSRDPLVQKIISLLEWLKESQKEIYFIWVPSHVGITVNEIADNAARQAAGLELIDTNLVRHADLRLIAEKVTANLWQEEWNLGESKLKFIKEEINKWKTPCKLTRREKVVLTRLRIGHSHITSFHLLRGEQQPRCASCGVLLTIKHILLECNEFNQTRQRLHVPNNLKKCLSNEKAEVKRTLTFIKEIGMFKKL